LGATSAVIVMADRLKPVRSTAFVVPVAGASVMRRRALAASWLLTTNSSCESGRPLTVDVDDRS
jgi:hypothetical protein